MTEEKGSLTRALTGAFAYVACADAELAASERDRFVAWATSLDAIDTEEEALAATFDELARGLQEDFEGHSVTVLEDMATWRSCPERELLLSAARVAMVADEKLRPVEETALARVGEALGYDPADL